MQQTVQRDASLGLEASGSASGFQRIRLSAKGIQQCREAVGNQDGQFVMIERGVVVVPVIVFDSGGHDFGDRGQIRTQLAKQARALGVRVLSHCGQPSARCACAQRERSKWRRAPVATTDGSPRH
ncbi:hypothetical protein [Nocardia amikacinitolerans]|uniref:hypothetical protein n=1 Tax=Nocardia amikacinitolerans TaxID=756689 RepID=UPI0020A4F34C|nr:hypothetical protein [Nocardia amikacinitolerans]